MVMAQKRFSMITMVSSAIALLILSPSISTSSTPSSAADEMKTPSLGSSWETCSTRQSCAECYQLSHTCHWCAHDNECHAKGSPLGGCIAGASCETTSSGEGGGDDSGDSEGNAWAWDSCSSHNTCDECKASSWGCHWCSDGACHAIGSLHGCSMGEACGAPEKDSRTCSDHKNCADCSSSSWGCHWCANDGACHAVGSFHGCAAGENCFAIDKCQRLEPERIYDGGTFSMASFQGVGPVAKGLLGVLLGLVLCCSTMCFAGAKVLRCAVDDLGGEPAEIVEEGRLVGTGKQERTDSQEETHRDELEIPLMQSVSALDDGISPKNHSSAASLGATSEARSRISLSSARATPKGSSIKQMCCGCQLCYLLAVLTSFFLFVIGMSFAPREPQYNVCTDELAWKSIVQGMASLKMSASFNLLISVYNPNRFEVDLSNGHGQFHHDDRYVGSLDIPEAKISEKAISDIVVKATFSPDKWDALSLVSEYYQGKLKLVIGGHAHVKIPGLGNYGFESKFDDIHVNLNDPSLDDTHLCACPEWEKP